MSKRNHPSHREWWEGDIANDLSGMTEQELSDWYKRSAMTSIGTVLLTMGFGYLAIRAQGNKSFSEAFKKRWEGLK